MAKNSVQDALQTEKRIHQAIIDIFVEQGWPAVTYGSIAKHTGLSRGGVQRIVPNKEAMMAAFQGQILQIVADKVDYTNDDTIEKSWLIALQNHQFSNCVKFLITSIDSETLGKQRAKEGLDKLADKVGVDTVQRLIGLSVYHLLS